MPKKKRRQQADGISDIKFLTIMQEFTDLYHYAPDTLDIALRCGYTREAVRQRLIILEREGLVARLPLTTNNLSGQSWQTTCRIALQTQEGHATALVDEIR